MVISHRHTRYVTLKVVYEELSRLSTSAHDSLEAYRMQINTAARVCHLPL